MYTLQLAPVSNRRNNSKSAHSSDLGTVCLPGTLENITANVDLSLLETKPLPQPLLLLSLIRVPLLRLCLPLGCPVKWYRIRLILLVRKCPDFAIQLAFRLMPPAKFPDTT